MVNSTHFIQVEKRDYMRRYYSEVLDVYKMVYCNVRNTSLDCFDVVEGVRDTATGATYPLFARIDTVAGTEYYINNNNYNQLGINVRNENVLFGDLKYDIEYYKYENHYNGEDTTYDTIDELIAELIPVFGDYADEYDIEAIAHDMSYWMFGKLMIYPCYDHTSDAFDQQLFNLLLMRHAIIKVVKA